MVDFCLRCGLKILVPKGQYLVFLVHRPKDKLFDENENKLMEDCRYLGVCTNNEAEYRALLLALDLAVQYTQQAVQCFLDSELVVRQLNGQYAVKSEKMAKFFAEVDLEGDFTATPRALMSSLLSRPGRRQTDNMSSAGSGQLPSISTVRETTACRIARWGGVARARPRSPPRRIGFTPKGYAWIVHSRREFASLKHRGTPRTPPS